MQENDEAFVDDEQEPDPAMNDWTNRIIGAAIEVHRIIGPGYSESERTNDLLSGRHG